LFRCKTVPDKRKANSTRRCTPDSRRCWILLVLIGFLFVQIEMMRLSLTEKGHFKALRDFTAVRMPVRPEILVRGLIGGRLFIFCSCSHIYLFVFRRGINNVQKCVGATISIICYSRWKEQSIREIQGRLLCFVSSIALLPHNRFLPF
jgi:hypothetical protein